MTRNLVTKTQTLNIKCFKLDNLTLTVQTSPNNYPKEIPSPVHTTRTQTPMPKHSQSVPSPHRPPSLSSSARHQPHLQKPAPPRHHPGQRCQRRALHDIKDGQ